MITTPPQNLSAESSKGVTFTCVATGNRAPNITWMRQDGVELSGNSILEDNITTTSILTLSNVMSDDFTNYSCIAENTAADNIIEKIVADDFANFTLYEAGRFVMYFM